MKYVQMHRDFIQAIYFITRRCIEYPAYSTGQCHQKCFMLPDREMQVNKYASTLFKKVGGIVQPLLESCRKIVLTFIPMLKINCCLFSFTRGCRGRCDTEIHVSPTIQVNKKKSLCLALQEWKS